MVTTTAVILTLAAAVDLTPTLAVAVDLTPTLAVAVDLMATVVAVIADAVMVMAATAMGDVDTVISVIHANHSLATPAMDPSVIDMVKLGITSRLDTMVR